VHRSERCRDIRYPYEYIVQAGLLSASLRGGLGVGLGWEEGAGGVRKGVDMALARARNCRCRKRAGVL